MKIKKYSIFVLLLAAAFMLLNPMNTIKAEASYGSWVQDTQEYKDFYQKSNITPPPIKEVDEGKENYLIQQLGNSIHFLTKQLSGLFRTSDINLTIDGIIFGKMAQPIDPTTGHQINYTGFDLSPGNIYGEAGSIIYALFRGLSYSGMFIMFLYLLAQAMLNNSPESIKNLKSGLYQIIISFMLIYLIPQVADLFIFLRDQFVYAIATALGTNGSSILDAMELMYNDPNNTSGHIIRAIVYAAVVGANLVYVKDYVFVAVEETILFGFFPVFNVLGVNKKKFLTDWASLFFSNLLYPMVDIITLMLPYIVLERMGDPANGRPVSLAGAIIICMMIWTARGCRNQILKLFGNLTGTPAGRGMGALMALSRMAKSAGHMIGDAAHGSARNGGNSEIEDWERAEKSESASAAEMNKMANEISGGLNDINTDMDETRESVSESRNEDITNASGIGEGMEDAEGQATENLDEFINGNAETMNADVENSTANAESELSSFDQQRMDNLETMEDMQGRMDNLRDSNADIDREIARLENQKEKDGGDALAKDINGNYYYDKMDATSNSNVADGKSNVSQVQASGNVANATQTSDSSSSKSSDAVESNASTKTADATNSFTKSNSPKAKTIDEQLADLRNQKATNNNKIRDYGRNIEKRREAETQFARVAKEHGKDGSTFKSSKEMKLTMDSRATRQAEAFEIAKKRGLSVMELKNFSPEVAAEIAKQQRQAIKNQQRKEIVANTAFAVAKTAAKVTVGTAAAATFATAGQDASVTAFAMGAEAADVSMRGARRATRGIVNTAKKVPDATKKVAEAYKNMPNTVEKVAYDVRKAPSNVKNTVVNKATDVKDAGKSAWETTVNNAKSAKPAWENGWERAKREVEKEANTTTRTRNTTTRTSNTATSNKKSATQNTSSEGKKFVE